MDALIAGAVVLALLLFAAAAAAPFVYANWRRAMSDDNPLPIGEMMARQKVSADDAVGLELELAYAVRRCAACPSPDTCREWLASGQRAGWEKFCPNAAFIGRLQERK